MNGSTPEKLGQSAKRSVAVPGQGGRGATVADVCLGAAEQKVRIFRLPGFVEDRGQTAALLPSSAYAKSLCLWRPSCILLRSFLPCKTCTRLHI